MGLNDVLSTSRNSLQMTSDQLGNVSRNIAGGNDPNYVRRLTQFHMSAFGGSYTTTQRMGNPVLLINYLSKMSMASGKNTLFEGVSRMNSIYGTNEYQGSPRQLLSEFKRALQNYANDPQHASAADAAVSKARELAEGLNRGSAEIRKLREDADSDIKNSVDKVNGLLQKLDQVEKALFQARDKDEAAFTYMDQRDSILKDLSQEMTITVHEHSDGTISVYAAEGVTLYDRTPRKVSFQASHSLTAGKKGNAVLVDGVPLSHGTFATPNGGGHIGNLLKLRDEIAPQYQKQLDSIAKALIDIFHRDPDAKPLNQSLFVVGNNKTKDLDGLAGRIEVNKEFLCDQGGSGFLLGSKEVVQKLVDALDQPRKYDPGTGLENGQSLIKFSESSLSWVGALYQDTKKDSEYHTAMYNHAAQSLSNATGVNRDDELALMLQLEQSYGASAKIITTVSKMMDDVLAMVR